MALSGLLERGASPAERGHANWYALGRTMQRLARYLAGPRPYLMLVGFALIIGFWYYAVEVWKLPRFHRLPSLRSVVRDWVSPHPQYGISIFVPDYYAHIWASVRRVLIAFVIATIIGVPLGLFLGWSRKFKAYAFPLFELLRPIPALAWVPLAIVIFSGTEPPIIFLTFLPAFFATALNTMLGVKSIDESYFRAASCLGASKWQTFRHVVIPGATPFIFTGLQIAMGVSWFSLVAGEMIAGDYGLGYLIYNGYTLLTYPTIVIGMITLGMVGYVSSAIVRMSGALIMKWRSRELALGA